MHRDVIRNLLPDIAFLVSCAVCGFLLRPCLLASDYTQPVGAPLVDYQQPPKKPLGNISCGEHQDFTHSQAEFAVVASDLEQALEGYRRDEALFVYNQKLVQSGRRSMIDSVAAARFRQSEDTLNTLLLEHHGIFEWRVEGDQGRFFLLLADVQLHHIRKQNNHSEGIDYSKVIALCTKAYDCSELAEYRGRALFSLALYQEKGGAHRRAAIAYQKLINEFPQHPLAADACLRAGRTLLYCGDQLKRRSESAADAQDGDLAEALLQEAEECYYVSGNAFAELAHIQSDNSSASKGQTLAGLAFMQGNFFIEAVNQLESVLHSPHAGKRQQSEAMYWLAEAYLKWSKSLSAFAQQEDDRVGYLIQAWQHYSALQEGFPDTKWSRYAEERMAEEVAFKRFRGDEQGRE